MAVAAFARWDALGRPLEPAQPVREMVVALKAAFPAAAHTFSWYADAAHYETNYPEDHTPYSVTGWPLPNPEWYVFATDVMHRPDLGVDCQKLFDYWIAEARAGRFPSLKYIIWQGKVYDVRNDWLYTFADGHYDHIHLSFRTDFLNVGFGTWNPVGDDVTADDLLNARITGVKDGVQWDFSVRDFIVGTNEAAWAALNEIRAFVGRGIEVSTKVGLSEDAVGEVADKVAAELAGRLVA